MAIKQVTDTTAAIGDAVSCTWTDHASAQQTATGHVTAVSAEHVTVLLDAPIEGAAASYVVFPHHSDVPGLHCRKAS